MYIYNTCIYNMCVCVCVCVCVYRCKRLEGGRRTRRCCSPLNCQEIRYIRVLPTLLNIRGGGWYQETRCMFVSVSVRVCECVLCVCLCPIHTYIYIVGVQVCMHTCATILNRCRKRGVCVVCVYVRYVCVCVCVCVCVVCVCVCVCHMSYCTKQLHTKCICGP
jgi:hypothetical protein